MKVTINNEEIMVQWKHVPPSRKFISKVPKKENTVENKGQLGSTVCFIKNASGKVISEGLANVRFPDMFCKSTGRIVSLTKALHGLMDRNLRRQVWSVYKEEIGFD